jgi:hypothetical protein
MWIDSLGSKESEWMVDEHAKNTKQNKSLGTSKASSVDSRLVKKALEFCLEKMARSSRLLTR